MTSGFSTRTPQQALAALLDRYAPSRLLVVGASEFPALAAFKNAHPDAVVCHARPGALPPHLAAQRFDLALVLDCLEHLPKREGLELLGGIRNLNASRIAVLADLNACGWKETDFWMHLLSLQRQERLPAARSYGVPPVPAYAPAFAFSWRA